MPVESIDDGPWSNRSRVLALMGIGIIVWAYLWSNNQDTLNSIGGLFMVGLAYHVEVIRRLNRMQSRIEQPEAGLRELGRDGMTGRPSA